MHFIWFIWSYSMLSYLPHVIVSLVSQSEVLLYLCFRPFSLFRCVSLETVWEGSWALTRCAVAIRQSTRARTVAVGAAWSACRWGDMQQSRGHLFFKKNTQTKLLRFLGVTLQSSFIFLKIHNQEYQIDTFLPGNVNKSASLLLTHCSKLKLKFQWLSHPEGYKICLYIWQRAVGSRWAAPGNRWLI